MLVLARQPGQSLILRVGKKLIRVCVVEVRPRRQEVKLGVDADQDVEIVREEIFAPLAHEAVATRWGRMLIGPHAAPDPNKDVHSGPQDGREAS